jgi:sugar O-acyltransferase (sialic acid O-acetyltransferase NeuD family)
MGRLFHDVADAITARGGILARVVLDRDVDPGVLARLAPDVVVTRLPALAGLQPTTPNHGFGFSDPRKEHLLAVLEPMGLSFPPIQHPMAWVSPRAVLGRGVFVGAQAAVAAHARVGDWSVINRGATIGHDTELGTGVRVHPGATVAGVSILGNRVVVGAGATVIDGIRVGDDVVLGAGAVATRHLLEPGTYVGIPARRLGSRPP